jgi:hypothetical protein
MGMRFGKSPLRRVYLGVDERIILEGILRKLCGKVWTEFI